jgi:hypothetical protein
LIEFMSTAVGFALAVAGGALVYRWPKSKWRSILKWPGLATFLFLVSFVSAAIEYDRARAEIYADRFQPSATCVDAWISCLATDDTQACAISRLCNAAAEQKAQDEELSLSLNRIKSMFSSVFWDFPVEVIGVILGIVLAGGRPKWSLVEEHLDE